MVFTSLLLGLRLRTTDMITSLKINQVFVFGSNLEGRHIGGAARQANEHFGAVMGIGVGMQGQSYAIPTMPPLTLIEIEYYIKQFIDYAKLTPSTEYLVTPIGTGIAGYTQTEIGEIWSKYELSKNIILL